MRNTNSKTRKNSSNRKHVSIKKKIMKHSGMMKKSMKKGRITMKGGIRERGPSDSSGSSGPSGPSGPRASQKKKKRPSQTSVRSKEPSLKRSVKSTEPPSQSKTTSHLPKLQLPTSYVQKPGEEVFVDENGDLSINPNYNPPSIEKQNLLVAQAIKTNLKYKGVPIQTYYTRSPEDNYELALKLFSKGGTETIKRRQQRLKETLENPIIQNILKQMEGPKAPSPKKIINDLRVYMPSAWGTVDEAEEKAHLVATYIQKQKENELRHLRTLIAKKKSPKKQSPITITNATKMINEYLQNSTNRLVDLEGFRTVLESQIKENPEDKTLQKLLKALKKTEKDERYEEARYEEASRILSIPIEDVRKLNNKVISLIVDEGLNREQIEALEKVSQSITPQSIEDLKKKLNLRKYRPNNIVENVDLLPEPVRHKEWNYEGTAN
jgi:hypothetical protein